MTAIAKVLIPNKSWILEKNGRKVATLKKEKRGYCILQNGNRLDFHNLSELKERFGITIEEKIIDTESSTSNELNEVYNYPVKGKIFNPLWHVHKKLPIYTKSRSSKSFHCAGYYVIKFSKGNAKSFCPKLITLNRYDYCGPYKTESEMKVVLSSLNKDDHATIEHYSN